MKEKPFVVTQKATIAWPNKHFVGLLNFLLTILGQTLQSQTHHHAAQTSVSFVACRLSIQIKLGSQLNDK